AQCSSTNSASSADCAAISLSSPDSTAGIPEHLQHLEQASLVLFRIRLPRLLGASLVGAALASSGAAYQGLFRNSLVSPDILGVSSGAGVGAVLALYLGFSSIGISMMSFAAGLGAVVLVGLLAQQVRTDSNLALVLSGILVGSLLASVTSFFKLLADPANTLPSITYWLMGSFSNLKEVQLVIAGPLILLSCFLLYLLRWNLNLLTMGEEEAQTLGVRIRLVRVLVIVSATLATAASVALSGPIGWVGLVIPHFSRFLAGSDYRRLLPVSLLMGASFLIVVDDCSRLLAMSEIPIGILTSFVGIPVFLFLILHDSWRKAHDA
ncbi:MAG: iron ABC transporter permease, partial [Termitinemataceae bacterium]